MNQGARFPVELRALGLCATALALTAVSPAVGRAQVVSDLESGVTPQELANSLIGAGVEISGVTYTGASRAAGIFSGAEDGLGFPAGVVLSSGNAQTRDGDPLCGAGVEGPNTCWEGGPNDADTSTELGLAGDLQLDGLASFPTFDASVLEFDFVPAFDSIQFRYVFSSEEYNGFVNTSFNDVFAFYVNGVNCALVPGTGEPVSVNTINNGNPGGDTTPSNPDLFLDNVRPTPSLPIEMDGLTTVLTCEASVNPGAVNHMKLAIADASDSRLDSAVFIQAGSFVSGTQIQTELSGGGQSGAQITVPAGTTVTDSATLMGINAGGASGTLTYTVYSDQACSSVFADAGTVAVSGGVAPPSNPILFDTPGTYSWVAEYSGDAQNSPGASPCGEEVLEVTEPPLTAGCLLRYAGWIHSEPAQAKAGTHFFRIRKKKAFVTGIARVRNGTPRAFHRFRQLWRHGSRFRARRADRVRCEGNTATVEGLGVLGEEPVRYTLELIESPWRWGHDQYRLRLESGFDTGVQPLKGRVKIRTLSPRKRRR